MKIFGIIVAIILLAGIAVVSAALYPVALVDGSLILARTWRSTEAAIQNFTNLELQLLNQPAIDFSSKNSEISLLLKSSLLTSLIEDAILRQEGEKIKKDFEKLAQAKIEEALRQNPNLEKATRVAYGLEFYEFEKLILLPQARLDVAREALTEKKQDFNQWLSEIKMKKKIRLLFTPFKWDGKNVIR